MFGSLDSPPSISPETGALLNRKAFLLIVGGVTIGLAITVSRCIFGAKTLYSDNKINIVNQVNRLYNCGHNRIMFMLNNATERMREITTV